MHIGWVPNQLMIANQEAIISQSESESMIMLCKKCFSCTCSSVKGIGGGGGGAPFALFLGAALASAGACFLLTSRLQDRSVSSTSSRSLSVEIENTSTRYVTVPKVGWIIFSAFSSTSCLEWPRLIQCSIGWNSPTAPRLTLETSLVSSVWANVALTCLYFKVPWSSFNCAHCWKNFTCSAGFIISHSIGIWSNCLVSMVCTLWHDLQVGPCLPTFLALTSSASIGYWHFTHLTSKSPSASHSVSLGSLGTNMVSCSAMRKRSSRWKLSRFQATAADNRKRIQVCESNHLNAKSWLSFPNSKESRLYQDIPGYTGLYRFKFGITLVFLDVSWYNYTRLPRKYHDIP